MVVMNHCDHQHVPSHQPLRPRNALALPVPRGAEAERKLSFLRPATSPHWAGTSSDGESDHAIPPHQHMPKPKNLGKIW